MNMQRGPMQGMGKSSRMAEEQQKYERADPFGASNIIILIVSFFLNKCRLEIEAVQDMYNR